MYKKLHVKKWKSKMPTYEPANFDLRIHTPEEIAGAMCQAELSHEVIVIFSFLPLFTVPAFYALEMMYPVFFLGISDHICAVSHDRSVLCYHAAV